MSYTWTCDICGAEHILEPDYHQECDHQPVCNSGDAVNGGSRVYVDFDKYPSFVANPGSTVSDFTFDEVHEYRRFYRTFTGKSTTPWGDESTAAARFYEPIVNRLVAADSVERSAERDEYIKRMSKEMLGPVTFWAIRITSWVLCAMVVFFASAFLFALVR